MRIRYFQPEMYFSSNEELHYFFWNINRQFPEYINQFGNPINTGFQLCPMKRLKELFHFPKIVEKLRTGSMQHFPPYFGNSVIVFRARIHSPSLLLLFVFEHNYFLYGKRYLDIAMF